MQKAVCFFLFFCILTNLSYSQTKIEGIAIDTVHKNVLSSASVSIYKKVNKSIEKVTLTDNYGKFSIEDIETNKTYILEIRFQGYRKANREFLFKKQGEHINLGKIHMDFFENKIAEVEVLPPIRMNGDTIEFNADAFKLDTNAVVEDLLKKLPGIVVWGDGSLSYKGRDIPNVLVNGKKFFGSDKAIVLQNLAKDAVQKLQIYDKRNKNEKSEDPLDVKYEMNVVLKKGLDNFYFGILSGGIGTSKRYDQQANINLATGKTQYSIAYSGNNSNKNLSSLDQLLKNTSYKGIGINADFDSDFLSSGIVKQHVIGGRYQYDIIGNNQVDRTHTIFGNILNRLENIKTENHSTTTLLSSEEGRKNYRINDDMSTLRKNISQGDFAYNNSGGKINKRHTNFVVNLALEKSKSNMDSKSLADYYYNNEDAEGDISGLNNVNLNKLSYSSILDVYDENSTPKIRVVENNQRSFGSMLSFGLKIDGISSNNLSNTDVWTTYRNTEDKQRNQDFHRSYNKLIKEWKQNADLSISYRAWVFTQKLVLNKMLTDQNVINYTKEQKEVNSDLTHISEFKQIQYEPRLQKSIKLKNRLSSGRSNSSLNLNLSMGVRVYKESNSSSLSYRNLNQQFFTVLPKIQLNNYYSKNGKFNIRNNFNVDYDEEYPNLDRLSPIYDNSNVAYRYFGNQGLNKIKRARVSFSSDYYEMRQNGLNISFNLNFTRYKNGLTDSIMFVNGQQQNYVVQISNPMSLFSFRVYCSKNILINKNNAINFKTNFGLNWGNKYQFIEQIEQEMITVGNDISINSYYTYKNNFQLGWINKWNRYSRKNKNKMTNNDDISNFWNSGLSISYAPKKRWHINVNATNRLSKLSDISDQALIWNANTSYRLLSGNNLEIKLSAYDILRENKGLYLYNSQTELTQGYHNNLTQYFMFSLSYFPRKFN